MQSVNSTKVLTNDDLKLPRSQMVTLKYRTEQRQT